MNKVFYKRNSGITLIALVVTIVVLLILAGITIMALGGENGLISRAKLAKTEQEKAQAKEELQLKITELQLKIVGEEAREATLDDFNNLIAEDEELTFINATYKTDSSEQDVDKFENIKVLYKNHVISVNEELQATVTEEDSGIILATKEEMLEYLKIDKDISVEDIVNNQNNVLETILNDENAVKYIVNNISDYEEITKTESGMSIIASSKCASYEMMLNAEWREKIYNSQYSQIFDEQAIQVPKLTENNSNILYSGIKNVVSGSADSYLYTIFDRNLSGDEGSASSPASLHGYSADSANLFYVGTEYPCYAGYNFEKKVLCYKFKYIATCTTNPSGYGVTPKKYKIQGSNNGEDWDTIYQGENTQSNCNGFYIIDEINPTKEYMMYKMVIETTNAATYYSYAAFNELQFYCVEK